MILYHFTAKHLFRDIAKEGLTMGYAPVWQNNKIKFSKKYRWLTSCSDFTQSWESGRVLIPYSRTDVRITIDIQNEENLIHWIIHCEKMKNNQLIKELNHPTYCDPLEWWLYKGNIPVECFIENTNRND